MKKLILAACILSINMLGAIAQPRVMVRPAVRRVVVVQRPVIVAPARRVLLARPAAIVTVAPARVSRVVVLTH